MMHEVHKPSVHMKCNVTLFRKTLVYIKITNLVSAEKLRKWRKGLWFEGLTFLAQRA